MIVSSRQAVTLLSLLTLALVLTCGLAYKELVLEPMAFPTDTESAVANAVGAEHLYEDLDDFISKRFKIPAFDISDERGRKEYELFLDFQQSVRSKLNAGITHERALREAAEEISVVDN